LTQAVSPPEGKSKREGAHVYSTKECANSGGLISVSSHCGALSLVSRDLLFGVVEHRSRVAAVSHLHSNVTSAPEQMPYKIVLVQMTALFYL
jgi:hypothetical protein